MPIVWTFLARNWKVVGIGILIALFFWGVWWVYDSGFDKGEAEARIEQVEAQTEFERTVDKTFRKVDNEAPITANRAERSQWLRSVSRAD